MDDKAIPILISNLILSNSDPEISAILAEPTVLAIWCLTTGNSK